MGRKCGSVCCSPVIVNVLLQKSCQEFDNKSMLDANGKKIKKKQTTLKHRKSLPGRKGFGSDDSEDEFKPTKAAAKKVEPKPKPAVAGPSKKESDDEKPAPAPKKAPVKKAPAVAGPSKKEESDEERPAPAPKKAPVKKAPPKVQSETESHVSDVPVKKAAARKAIKVDSDSDIVMVDSPPVQAKGKGKAKAEDGDGPKRKSYVFPVFDEML